YKQHRLLLQYGTFYRFNRRRDNQMQWQVVDATQQRSIVGHYQSLAQASPGFDRLQVNGLQEDATYSLQTKLQKVSIKRFGALINHISPIKLHPEGLAVRVANKVYQLNDAQAHYEGSGRLFMQGIGLSQQFMGTGTNDNVRLMGDFGSNLYLIERKQPNE
ncbi:MAG: GH36 C-terminal domain-containing protein, partial [Erysipelotrichaceae bacterium]